MSYTFKHLQNGDETFFRSLIELFGEVFDEPMTYKASKMSDTFLRNFLDDRKHIVLVAISKENKVVGGLVAYELKKFEQDRSEIFVYDLAVLEAHRRNGIATNLFRNLQPIALKRNAYEIFVQADEGDDLALSLYRSLDSNELRAHHFEIPVV
jgi:aminoglycoside 3-N-acetyltransferase I